MDATFSDEQLELQATVRRLFAELTGPTEGRPPDGAEMLRRVMDLGATDLPSETDRGIVFEEAGYSCLAAPLVSVLGAAIPVLEALPDAAWLLESTIAGSATPVPAMTSDLVPDAGLATHFIVRVGDDVGIVDADDCSVDPVETLDFGRPLGVVQVRGTPTVVGPFEPAGAALLTYGLVATSHELAGVARRCVDFAVDHARNRSQFGKQIGAFQAISHQCVDMYIWADAAQNHAYHAAWALSAGASNSELAVRQAHAVAVEAALFCAHRAIQVLGGVGFTWEHPIHRYLRRAHSSATLFSTARQSRDRVGSLIGLQRDAGES